MDSIRGKKTCAALMSQEGHGSCLPIINVKDYIRNHR